ncbi:uncharacterized protein LOC126900088 isoform X2 [Daktulosphaira vitifoliae]|uniref:uncharacterized protein LOC126900088 isoform X2 n=1 Tax=Daktulosphaira vitifoliae TaxID=58002 RepID=UPI0021A9DF9A|nr:uncharacterized protein LOC126900088 isoform X2 [Daktulosphaira vitifoliae]
MPKRNVGNGILPTLEEISQKPLVQPPISQMAIDSNLKAKQIFDSMVNGENKKKLVSKKNIVKRAQVKKNKSKQKARGPASVSKFKTLQNTIRVKDPITMMTKSKYKQFRNNFFGKINFDIVVSVEMSEEQFKCFKIHNIFPKNSFHSQLLRNQIKLKNFKILPLNAFYVTTPEMPVHDFLTVNASSQYQYIRVLYNVNTFYPKVTFVSWEDGMYSKIPIGKINRIDGFTFSYKDHIIKINGNCDVTIYLREGRIFAMKKGIEKSKMDFHYSQKYLS